LRGLQKTLFKLHKTINLPDLLNKTKNYKKLLLKSEIIANILNVVSADEKSLPDCTCQINCKSSAVNLQKFFYILKIAWTEGVLPVEQNLIREEISTSIKAECRIIFSELP
jgi:hypothetical protein